MRAQTMTNSCRVIRIEIKESCNLAGIVGYLRKKCLRENVEYECGKCKRAYVKKKITRLAREPLRKRRCCDFGMKSLVVGRRVNNTTIISRFTRTIKDPVDGLFWCEFYALLHFVTEIVIGLFALVLRELMSDGYAFSSQIFGF